MAEGSATPSESIDPHLTRHGKVAYIAIPARDPITSGVFYEAVFDWTLTPPDEERVSYTLGPRDNVRVPFTDTESGLSGAFVASRGPSSDGVLLHIYVEDIEGVLREVEARDLAIVEPLRTQDGIRMAQFRDPGGNTIGIWEAGAP
ncbi:MAG: VOC family protein [Dehalococcoidia bacterium]|nr:VOC family protein [Dehalococcoidia bacterium]